jgi:hypothetical protein
LIIYLTYNEQPSGIFSSQVIDVVRFVEQDVKMRIKLIAFISGRNYFINRKKIKAELPKAVVVPMVPRMRNWRMNRFLLNILVGTRSTSCIIARSVLATNLALETTVKKIVYDGRGAIAAEWKEYNVVDDPELLSQIEALEKNAVLNSDQRIAVSNKLINYWKEKFDYRGDEHVVIPCTLNKAFEKFKLDKETVQETRESLGIENYEIAFVYAGSLAGWQSFDLMYPFLKLLLQQKDHKVVFYSDIDPAIEKLEKEFPSQIIRRKIDPREMPAYLAACDYGFLIREKSVTNSVASPLKFAEYLASGLKIFMSDGIGDYSTMLQNNEWGWIYDSSFPKPVRPSLDEKINVSLKAKELFSKRNYLNEYKKIVA